MEEWEIRGRMALRSPPEDVFPHPNYDNPELQKPYLIPVLVIMTIAATCMVFLRLYTRFFHARMAGSDDWLIIISIIPAIGYTICISIAVTHFDWNRHVYDIPPGPNSVNRVRTAAIAWACQMLYQWTSSLTKLSLLSFYRRAFTPPKMQRIVSSLLAIVVAYTIGTVLMLCLECRPLSYYWEEFRSGPSKTEGGYCIDEGPQLITASVLNIVLDLILLVLPIRTVFTLDIIWSQKLQVLSTFAAGSFVVIASAIRTYEIWQTTEVTFDVTWKGYEAFLFTGIEIYLGLICACLPACRGLLKQWRECARLNSVAAHHHHHYHHHHHHHHHNDDSNSILAKRYNKRRRRAFTSTIDSTRASMPPPTNAIKARTKTTVNVEYMKMDNVHYPTYNGVPEMNLGINLSIGDTKVPFWGSGTNPSATNITEAWAGKKKRTMGGGLVVQEEEEEEEEEKVVEIGEQLRVALRALGVDSIGGGGGDGGGGERGGKRSSDLLNGDGSGGEKGRKRVKFQDDGSASLRGGVEG